LTRRNGYTAWIGMKKFRPMRYVALEFELYFPCSSFPRSLIGYLKAFRKPTWLDRLRDLFNFKGREKAGS